MPKTVFQEWHFNEKVRVELLFDRRDLILHTPRLGGWLGANVAEIDF